MSSKPQNLNLGPPAGPLEPYLRKQVKIQICMTPDLNGICPIYITDLCPFQVLDPASLGLDQVVAVDGGGHGHFGQAAADELQHGHLGRGVLHSHAVGPQTQVRAAPVDLLAVGVVQVTIHDLLRQGEWPVEPSEKKTLPYRFCGLELHEGLTQTLLR